LVVDDYVPARNLIVEALSQLGQYEISEAENGVEALKQFRTERYDMVISDVMMPGMGGVELLDAIKKADSPATVIMITAYPAVELAVSTMKQGAVDFLKKPFNIDDLLFKVNLYLNEDAALIEDTANVKDNYFKAKREELLRQSYIYDAIEKMGVSDETLFQKIVELALRIAGGDSCALFLYDKEINEFYHKVASSGNGFDWRNAMPAMKSLFSEVVDKKDAVMVNSDSDPLISPSLICAPLMIRDNVMGVLCIRKKKNGETFTNKDLHYVLSLVNRASLNVENKVLYESIYGSLMETFKSLVASIQFRDHYTEEHSGRAAEMAVKIARAFGCSPNEVESLRIASMLHDIGKISTPDSILLKCGKLSPDEYQIVKNHASIGADILSSVVLLDKERDIIRHHHERWDGLGYPNGLAGERIPLMARIMAVADSFDAMTSDRPYRKGISLDHTTTELKKNSNTQFDRKIVDVFLNIL